MKNNIRYDKTRFTLLPLHTIHSRTLESHSHYSQIH
jgi:hypothetical protein